MWLSTKNLQLMYTLIAQFDQITESAAAYVTRHYLTRLHFRDKIYSQIGKRN